MKKPILIRDHFENAKQYQIPRADLIICDLPYELGEKMYASNPSWYTQGDRTQGESKLAHKAAFNTDYKFSIPNFFSFATRLLRKEPGKGEKGAPCMIVFCSFQQIPTIISEAEKAGFKHAQHLSIIKKSSPQALKANMKICGATEHALLLYRGKLPKFNNVDEHGQKHMILDWFPFERDDKSIPVSTPRRSRYVSLSVSSQSSPIQEMWLSIAALEAVQLSGPHGSWEGKLTVLRWIGVSLLTQ